MVQRRRGRRLGYPDASFDTVATCTMLHHVPTRALQDKVLAEAFRVLRPGGTFLGSDSLPSDDLHQFHEGDTYNPVEPAAFLTRLQTVGFAAITLHVSYNLVFTARKARRRKLAPEREAAGSLAWSGTRRKESLCSTPPASA